MSINSEIEELNELISIIENQLKFYEDFNDMSKQRHFYESLHKPLENGIETYKTMLEVLKAKRDRLISIRDNKSYTLSYGISYKERLKCQY